MVGLHGSCTEKKNLKRKKGRKADKKVEDSRLTECING